MRGHREKACGYFGEWFDARLTESGHTLPEVCAALHMELSTIRKQRVGISTPKFLQILGYIWFFQTDDDPEELYRKCWEDMWP